MNKKIMLVSLSILIGYSSITSALWTASCDSKAEALKKYHAEREVALNNLKKAGIAGGILLVDVAIPLVVDANAEWLNYHVANAPIGAWLTIAMIATTIGAIGYGSYKGYQGGKHLLYPDNPNPEEAKK